GVKLLHMRYSPDGRGLTGVTDDGQSIDWDVATGRELRRSAAGEAPARGARAPEGPLSAQGRTAAGPAPDGPSPAVGRPAGGAALSGGEYNRGSGRLVCPTADRVRVRRGDRLIEWDLRTGRALIERPVPEEEWKTEAFFHPDRPVFARYDFDASRLVVTDSQ